MNKKTIVLSAACVGALALGVVPPAGASTDLNPATIGFSSFGISTFNPVEVDATAFNLANGTKLSTRIFWPDVTTWNHIQPTQNSEYQWHELDKRVNTYRNVFLPLNPFKRILDASGRATLATSQTYHKDATTYASEILYGNSHFPSWAWKYSPAAFSQDKKFVRNGTRYSAAELCSRSNSIAPKPELYEKYIHDVYSRYFGRITSIEVANEVDSLTFFCGTPQDLVDMTFAAKNAVDRVYREQGGKAWLGWNGTWFDHVSVPKARVVAPNFAETAMLYNLVCTPDFQVRKKKDCDKTRKGSTANVPLSWASSSKKFAQLDWMSKYYYYLGKEAKRRGVALPAQVAATHGYSMTPLYAPAFTSPVEKVKYNVMRRTKLLSNFKNEVRKGLVASKFISSKASVPLAFWDTEFNLSATTTPWSVPQRNSKQTASAVIKTLLEGVRLGYDSQMWYSTVDLYAGTQAASDGFMATLINFSPNANYNQVGLANLNSLITNTRFDGYTYSKAKKQGVYSFHKSFNKTFSQAQSLLWNGSSYIRVNTSLKQNTVKIIVPDNLSSVKVELVSGSGKLTALTDQNGRCLSRPGVTSTTITPSDANPVGLLQFPAAEWNVKPTC